MSYYTHFIILQDLDMAAEPMGNGSNAAPYGLAGSGYGAFTDGYAVHGVGAATRPNALSYGYGG